MLKLNCIKNILKAYLSPPYFPIDFVQENKFLKFVDFEGKTISKL